MQLYKKFSNLSDVRGIIQLSNSDILISSKNKIKIFSSKTFQNLYSFAEFNSIHVSINDVHEIQGSNKNEIILSINTLNYKFRIILLKVNSKSNQKYSRELLYNDIEQLRNFITVYNASVDTFLNNLIISLSSSIFYFKMISESGKYNLIKEKEYVSKDSCIFKAMKYLNHKGNDYIITIEKKVDPPNKGFNLRIYYYENFELITQINNLNLSTQYAPSISFMTLFDLDKPFLVVGDHYDKLLIVKLFDDVEIYGEICLSKSSKKFPSTNSFNFEIKTVCGLNDGTFIVGLTYILVQEKINYLIRGKINFKNKKFQLVEINDNAHNNKQNNFITSSSLIRGNNKSDDCFIITGDNEGILNVWKY